MNIWIPSVSWKDPGFGLLGTYLFIFPVNHEIKEREVNKGWEKELWHDQNFFLGLPWWSSGYESTLQHRGHWLDPWSGKTPQAAGQPSLCAITNEPVLWSPYATATEPTCPRAQSPRREKPPQWEVPAGR